MTASPTLSGIAMALDAIREHKMRSLLTVLGVIIGTTCVIAVGSIITGVDGVIVDITKSFGPDTAFVYKFNIGFRGNITGDEIRRKPLTWENARAIKERCPSVLGVSPYLFPPTLHARYVHRRTDRRNSLHYRPSIVVRQRPPVLANLFGQ